MKFDLDKLKKIPILDIAKELGIVVKGNKAMCFYGHDNKTPSLSFSPAKSLWHCFGCGAGGDCIELVKEYLDIDFRKACSWIEERFFLGYKMNSSSLQQKSVRKRSKDSQKSGRERNKADPEVYEWLINSCVTSSACFDFFVKKRGYSKKTIQKFNIRDIEKPWLKFREAKKIWGTRRLRECGLARVKGRNIEFIWWNHIVLFPFYNIEDRVDYLQGRQIGNRTPKYVNLVGVETEIYNLNVLSSLKRGDQIYICEGITDVLSAYELGLKAVGIIGAHGFKSKWAYLFRDYNIRVVPDADSAGIKFASRVENSCQKIGKSIQIIKLPDGLDLSDFVREFYKKNNG